ncbi:MAG: lamin tail domain-containing protein [Opitutaceae bacterium]
MFSSKNKLKLGILLMSFFMYQAVFATTPPVISSFDADESVVSPGTDVTLTWVVSDADDLYLNGTLLEGVVGSSIDVSPLIATTYTLQAVNAFGSDSAALTVQVTNVPTAIGADVRFIEVVKNNTDDRLHLSEIEAFVFGATPNEADGDGTSSNNLVLTASPSTVIPPTSTGSDLNGVHTAVPADVYDGDLEAGADVWSTNDNLSSPGTYMLDLGATYTIDVVRLFGRADGSSRRGLEDFTVNVYADDGSGNPGALVNSDSYPGTAPRGDQGNAEFSFAFLEPGITSFTVSKTTIAAGEDITFSWTVSTSATDVYIDNGVGDVLPLTDAQGEGDTTLSPGPSVDTTYLLVTEYPNGTSVASITVHVTDQPLIHGFGGDAGIVAPGTAVQLSWDVVSATSVSLNGVDVSGVSSMTVNPTITTSYELVATNANGTTSEEVIVLVVNSGEPIISEFLASNGDGLIDEDVETSDWIEIYNSTTSSLNLNGYYLSDDPLLLTKWAFPSVSLAPGEYLVVFASSKDRSVAGSELHTNFNLSTGGDYLALVKPNGTTILSEFQPTYPDQKTDISYGFDEAALKFGYFQSPTPGAANSESASGFVADTSFSLDRGFYDAPIAVAITSLTPGAEIRYTVDGTEPTAVTGQSYVNPLVISETTVLRAVALKSGMIPTNVDTQTYIFTADVVTQPNMDTAITQDPTYGPQMEDALKAVPTVSLVFEGDIERTEKAISIEFINFEAGSTQVGVGMERFGNYATDFSKRSMRMTFRNQYGPGKLDFPVFDGHDYAIPPAAQFDGLELRSGNHDMSMRGAYLSNRFTDDTMLDMGNISPHGRFVHVYINGNYWGQYHLRERWNASMLSEYFGGSKADYEAVNANNSGQNFDNNDGSVFDGSGVQWEAAKTVRDEIALGNQSFPDIVDLVDIPNLIDFVMLWVSGNSESEFRAAGGVPLGVPFKFFMKDADGFLRNSSRNVLEDGPLDLLTILRTDGDADYLTLAADRIHKHFFNDGALTPAKNIERLQNRVTEIQLSFLAESARWGERTPASWQAYQDDWIDNKFPALTATMIARFKAAGMYPSIDAPVFSQHGGDVTAGFQLTMTSGVPTIYYTLNGSDPRVSATVTGTTPPLTVVTENAAKSVYIPTTTTDGFTDGQGDVWTELDYDQSGWTSGSGGVGFEDSPGDAINYASLIGLDVGGTMSNQYASCLIRIPFNLSAGSLSGRQVAELRVRYDDGYVAYLNGVEVARKNFTGTPDGLSTADDHNSDASAVNLEVVDISAHMNLFIEGGSNILSIHGMNRTAGSSDFVISADLVVGESGATGTSGAISSSAIAYSGPVQINESTLVRARVFDGSNWSALNEAFFTVNAQEPSVGDLVISEIHYNGYETGDVEFIEFYNNAAYNLIMDGVQITNGVTFLFPNNVELKVGERLVVVSDLNAFIDRYQDVASPWYHSDIQVVGVYNGSLSGSGEGVTVEDAYSVELLDFAYNDSGSWPGRPDGFGSSLELISPSAAPVTKLELDAYLDDGDSWRASREFHGSPGWEGLGPDNRVVFNEVLPHTDLPLKDSFELYNTTGSSINISGWLISDNTSTYAKFQIPNGTNIAAGGFLVYDEDDFNSGSNLIDFALNSSLGDDLYLLETDSEDNPISFVDHVRFDPSKNGESFGRWLDGDGQLYPMINRTLGQLNTSAGNGIRVGPVVVSEIHYSPLDLNQPLEFIEIFNAGTVSQSLANWRLRGEADFDFASESLAPGAVLVITSFDPITDTVSLNQFLAEYPGVSSSQLRGPWSAGATNRLNNGGAAVKLQRPDTLQVPPVGDPFYPMLIEDTVNYDNRAPWPASADGTGPSLERKQTDVYGDLASNWQANATPSPGTHNLHVFSDYETWAAANALGAGPLALRTGDIDYDGSLNLVEFALVKNPWDNTDGQPFDYGFKQLTVGLETAQYLTVDFQYRLGAGLTVGAFVSSDLENWDPLVDQYIAPIDHGNGVQSVFFRDFVDSDENTKRFIKIEVIEE